jgi:hypothetical protein
METIAITLPSRLAARARSLAEVQRQNLPEFLLVELQHVLKRKEPERTGRASRRPTNNWRIISDHEVMNLANLRMEKWQALQMHRLIHQAGTRQLSSEEQKILDTLLEIHNELGSKKATAIAEAIRRGLLPPANDRYWNPPPRRKLTPKKKNCLQKKSGGRYGMISNGAIRIVKCRLFICHRDWKQSTLTSIRGG